MPKSKQKKRTKKRIPVRAASGLNIDLEIEQGLKAIAGKAGEGDPQALKLLIAYREERKSDAGDVYFSALAEVERRALRSALIQEVTSLREEITSVQRASCGA
ncbi:MAG: hypothetical protein NOU37_08400 [Candidatus Brocadiales bacterium]|nr:hypothetical protein [Candidatus Bathyanammoxibius sp.]MCQ4575251.1 hypothetical protein [Candidatus Bathyanammoxibius amoris]